MTRHFLIFFLAITIPLAHGALRDFVIVSVGKNAQLSLPETATYRRTFTNAKGVEQEHLFTVCTAKNKPKCGNWVNVKTNKTVASGVTTYNKTKKMLIIKKVKANDFGTYRTGAKKFPIDLVRGIGRISK